MVQVVRVTSIVTMGCLDNESSETMHLDRFRASMDLLLMLLIIVANSFIIFAVVHNWIKHGMPLGNKISTFLVINLSTADALVGFCYVPYFLPRYYCQSMGHQLVSCILRFSPVIMAHLASGYTLITIALDRYVAVVHAVQYDKILTVRRISIIIASSWILAVMVSSLPFVWNNWEDGKACIEGNILPIGYMIIMGLGNFIIMGVLSYVHWKIHRVALSIHNRNQCLSITQKMNTRSARVLLIIVGVYTVSWSPFMVLLIIKTTRNNVSSLALQIASSFVITSYLVNPLLYAYNNRPVREAMSNAFRVFKIKVPHQLNDSTTPSASVNKT